MSISDLFPKIGCNGDSLHRKENIDYIVLVVWDTNEEE